VKKHTKSEVAGGFIKKFQGPFEDPYTIRKEIDSTLFELKDEKGKLIGLYNLRHLKPYQRKEEEI
jgi:hypothetical protein